MLFFVLEYIALVLKIHNYINSIYNNFIKFKLYKIMKLHNNEYCMPIQDGQNFQRQLFDVTSK